MAWEGQHTWNGTKYPAKLTVTSRTKEKFEGKLTWILNQEVETRVAGKATEAGVTFTITKVEKGGGIFLASYEGKVAGDKLVGKWVYKGPAGETLGLFSYTAVKPKRP